jgi:hypothetical protein
MLTAPLAIGMLAAGDASLASPSALPQVGIPLGILIGVLSGLVSLAFLRTLQAVKNDSGAVLKLAAELIAIPTLWFSAPFVSKLLAGISPERLVTAYVIALAITWVMIMLWPLLRLIIATASEMGQ